MGKMRKVIVSIVIVVIFVASISSVAIYYQSLLTNRDTEISALQSQVEDKNQIIANLSSQVSNLESELTNLTLPKAKISSVTRDSIYPAAIVGVATMVFFYVNVTNTGIVPINNASVVVQNLGNQKVANGKYISNTYTVSLQPNQTVKAHCQIYVGLNEYKEAIDLGYLITVNYEGKILAQMKYGYRG